MRIINLKMVFSMQFVALLSFALCLPFVFGAPYWIPDNTSSGDSTMKCEAFPEKSMADAIASIKRKWPHCKEPKETLVKGNLLLPCRHPTNISESKVLVFSETKEVCEAQIHFNNTNMVPVGFENPNKLKKEK